MKRTLALIITVILAFGAFASVAYAAEVGDTRVTIGANLDEAQIAQIYKDFGIERGSVTELKVTNDDERAYLEGLVDEKKIGHVALSCTYIVVTEAGTGLNITTNKINYCTADMYKNALTTAGISDAKVMVSAPYDVSGTAALTGIYKAYEDISGISLSEIAKAVGAEELVRTGELAEYIGSEDATKIVNELKNILDQTANMTDAEVLSEIKGIATTYNVSLSEDQTDSLLKLCRSLEKLDVDELKDKLVSLTKGVETANKVSQTFTKIGDGIKTFFASVGSFFTNLFGSQGN